MKSLTAILLLVVASATAQTNSAVIRNGFQSGTNSVPMTDSNATKSSAIELGERLRNDCIQGRRSICGRILRVFPEGLLVESGYTNLLREPLTKSWLVPGSVTVSRPNTLVESTEPGAMCVGTVFVTDLPRGKPHQYDYVILTGYPVGQHTYHSVGTIQKTVRHFSANLEKAVQQKLDAIENAQKPSEAK